MTTQARERTRVRFPTGVTVEVDEEADLADMERAEPRFFQVKFGSRETFTVHRGCLIVRNTVSFGGRRPTRHTAAYLFVHGPDGKNLSCVSSGTNLGSIAEAKNLIDHILDGGEYYYGITPK